MSGFQFDTGAKSVNNWASSGMADAWIAAVRDQIGEDAPPSAFHKAAADQIINDMWAKKTAVGVRRAFWSRIEIIRTMGNAHAAQHDRVLFEFVERLAMLAGSPEEPGETAQDEQSQTSSQLSLTRTRGPTLA